jgi:putative oxidoreductase
MAILDFYDGLTARLRTAGEYVWPLALRLILCWEFWESGSTKFRGQNWFADIPWADWQKGFPWPFSQASADLNWLLASWGELVLAFLLLFGLFTRFAAISLIVITMVATAAVHWPADWSSLAGLWEGYVITARGAGNFKLPLLFLILLLPLVFHGGGKLSLDRLLLRLTRRGGAVAEKPLDGLATGLALLVLGLSAIWVEPVWGGSLLVLAALAAATPPLWGNR